MDPSEIRVDDVEWMQLAYDGTVSAPLHTIMNLWVSLSAGKAFISWPKGKYRVL